MRPGAHRARTGRPGRCHAPPAVTSTRGVELRFCVLLRNQRTPKSPQPTQRLPCRLLARGRGTARLDHGATCLAHLDGTAARGSAARHLLGRVLLLLLLLLAVLVLLLTANINTTSAIKTPSQGGQPREFLHRSHCSERRAHMYQRSSIGAGAGAAPPHGKFAPVHAPLSPTSPLPSYPTLRPVSKWP